MKQQKPNQGSKKSIKSAVLASVKSSISSSTVKTMETSTHAKKKMDLETMRKRIEARDECRKRHKEYLQQLESDSPVHWTNVDYWRNFYQSFETFHPVMEDS